MCRWLAYAGEPLRPAEVILNTEHSLVAPPDELFVGEDAIGTKLDLAKAYLDMGDPEGARSMLDEVMSEGNDSQKDEARKLLAEIKLPQDEVIGPADETCRTKF